MKAPAVISALLFVSMSGLSHAAGSDSSEPPKPTQTSKECKAGEIYDPQTKKCSKVKSRLFSDDTLFAAVRELAYAGHYQRALGLLDLAAKQDDPRILNYRGFVNRKLGNMDVAMSFYKKALKIDPDYNLARSYMGQGLISQGKMSAARRQLYEIHKRGGHDSWAYASLAKSLSGAATHY